MVSIDKATTHEIFKKIATVIDGYLIDGANIDGLKRYFKHNSSLSNLITDINNIREDKFENNIEYRKYIKHILDKIISDREAYTKDTKTTDNKIGTFKNFTNKNNQNGNKEI